ncbi:MAG: hypothetical protein WCC66_08730 [Rhizobiaceae bacterium]
MGKLIDKIPIQPLAIAALILALVPFVPEPHLLEKIRWLLAGLPFKPVDWLDLLMHGTPLLLLLAKTVRILARR